MCSWLEQLNLLLTETGQVPQMLAGVLKASAQGTYLDVSRATRLQAAGS